MKDTGNKFMYQEPISFGIVGCGMISNIHAQAIKRIPSARLVGVADKCIENARQFAEKYQIKSYDDYAHLLSDPEIQVICVCTPSCFHAKNAIDAMEHGKHVVLEKPMALTAESADEIIRTCQKTGMLLTVISQLRFSEDIREVKKLLEENAIGKVSLCSLYMKYYRSRDYYASSSWKGRRSYDGGGALLNQGIHGVDLLEYIAGSVKKIHGKVRTISHQIEVEDTAVAMLEFENGALGVIEASTCAYPGFERRLEICGDEGYILLEDNRISKMMIHGEEVNRNLTAENETASDPTNLSCEMHQLQIQNLIAAIKGEENLLIDCYEGKKAVRLINEIYRFSEAESNEK